MAALVGAATDSFVCHGIHFFKETILVLQIFKNSQTMISHPYSTEYTYERIVVIVVSLYSPPSSFSGKRALYFKVSMLPEVNSCTAMRTWPQLSPTKTAAKAASMCAKAVVWLSFQTSRLGK